MPRIPEHYEPQHIKLWTSSDPATGTGGNYMGETYPDWYVAAFRHRDSDILAESNWEVTVQRLSRLDRARKDIPHTVQVIRTGHWAVGWAESLLIHGSNPDALRAADDIRDSLNGYSVLDEDDFGRREDEEAQRVWKDCYSPQERIDYIREHRSQFEFHGFLDMLGCVRGEYFAGYASELIA